MREASEDFSPSSIGRGLLLIGLVGAASVLAAGCQSPPAGAREPRGTKAEERSNSTKQRDTRANHSTSATADEGADMQPLAPHAGKHRPVVVFAPGPEHETFERQMEAFETDQPGLEERDIVVYRVFENTEPRGPGETQSQDVAEALRERFQPSESFTVVLVGKDTTEKLHSEDLLSVEELFDTIDAMPMRQREIQRDN
jgi:hypothetical protein